VSAVGQALQAGLEHRPPDDIEHHVHSLARRRRHDQRRERAMVQERILIHREVGDRVLLCCFADRADDPCAAPASDSGRRTDFIIKDCGGGISKA
jgi:hypothetical protein